MKEEKVFTQEELEELGTRTLDLIQRAIELGDKKKAMQLSERMYREAVVIHDVYGDWVATLLTFIGRRYGDDVLHQALEEMMAPVVEEMLGMYDKADIKERVRRLARVLRMHFQPVEIKEEKEKFVLKMKPCGSGGRLVLEGKYKPPRNFLRVKRAQPMTYGKADFPVYCCHAHFITSLPVKKGRVAPFFEIAADKPGEEPCEFWLYKDPEAAPPEAYVKCGVKSK